MSNQIRLVLALHNHQPIGNFDDVIERAYHEAYRPFLDLFASYPAELKISLHTSGCLMEWLAAKHPEYLDAVGELAADGRIELLGGPFYESILPMIPRRDRVGQIRSYSQWLQERFDVRVRGMWVPERVWEQSLVADLAEAGVEYTLLDDYHFRSAGLRPDQLDGYYVTEDEGRVLAVFPGSERLRYAVPFADPHETIEHLRRIANDRPDAVVVFGDDGEKFGAWPHTHQHVYDDGWLRRFFDALLAESSWLKIATLGEAVDAVPPVGKIYLPDACYREMTEWALPVERQVESVALAKSLEHDERWPRLKPLVRGGFWRNFKVKYPETDEMYSRMMLVSNRLHRAETEGGRDAELVEAARRELYRAQCNCSYWHGAFGGIYLPHLRNAVYEHLIAADDLLDRASSEHEAARGEPWVEAAQGDFNFDARKEIYLANDRFAAFLSPHEGGQLYEFDVRAIRRNLLATLARRPEAYHRTVVAAAGQANESQLGAIHDAPVFKQPDLDRRLVYDAYARKALQDHFFDDETTLGAVVAGQAAERGDFLHGGYEAKLLRNPHRIQARLTREGNAWGVPLRITKGLTLEMGSGVIDVAYLIEGLPPGRAFHFAVEFNLAGLPADCADRFFHDGRFNRLGDLGAQLDLADCRALHLTDEWLGLDVGFRLSEPAGLWTFPIATVSQSEGGYELVQQSVCVMPHWRVQGDAAGRWAATMQIVVDTTQAERRATQAKDVAATV